VCNEGFRCNPDQPNILEACPPSRDMWQQVDVCQSALLCNPTAQKCDTGCGQPGTYRCNGSALQLCDADGIQWTTEQTCNTVDECHVGKHDCVRCQEGEWQCNSDRLQRCNAQQSWETRETCASAGLCQVVSESTEQTCLQGCPKAGEFSCVGRQLVECSADLVSLDLREVCASPGLCNPTDKRCNVPGCPAPGEQICAGNELRRCRDDQAAYDMVTTCAAGTICDSEGGGCLAECPTDPYRCNGAQPEKCVKTSDFFGWQVVGAPCASHDLCHSTVAGPSCDEPACGDALANFRCEGSELQACNNQRTGWDPLKKCDADSFCDAGLNGEGPPQCDICQPNTYACANGALQRCSTDGQMILTVEQCRGPT
jgi:hypothetical protein